MKAGRVLDVLIAEKVIGFKPSPSGEALLNPETNLMCVHPDYEDSGKYVFAKINDWTIPYYSTNIAHAWLVVENFYYVDIRKVNNVDEDRRWKWAAWVSHGDGYSHNATAETAPLAICIAALKAVGVDVE